MIKKFKEIANAWITAANPTPEEKFIAAHRASICNGCEHRKQNTTLIDFYYCDLCGCPLNKKIFAQDKNSCPKSKWDK
jgi:hypothetical protein